MYQSSSKTWKFCLNYQCSSAYDSDFLMIDLELSKNHDVDTQVEMMWITGFTSRVYHKGQNY